MIIILVQTQRSISTLVFLQETQTAATKRSLNRMFSQYRRSLFGGWRKMLRLPLNEKQRFENLYISLRFIEYLQYFQKFVK